MASASSFCSWAFEGPRAFDLITRNGGLHEEQKAAQMRDKATPSQMLLSFFSHQSVLKCWVFFLSLEDGRVRRQVGFVLVHLVRTAADSCGPSTCKKLQVKTACA